MMPMFGAKKRSKYRAIPVTLCVKCDAWHEPGPLEWRGQCINCRYHHFLRFASKAEARRYATLKARSVRGEISDLQLQPRFALTVNGVKIATYVGDFAYMLAGARVVEDVKGMQTPLFKLKRKLLAALHGVTVEVVS